MGDPMRDLVETLRHRPDERAIEYIWVRRNLILKGRLLDVGCCESQLAPALAKMGYEVYGIDIRFFPIIRGWGGALFVQEDIRRTSLPSEHFDQILAISTIEHVGMNCYGNTWFDKEHGDRMAILEMYRLLKSDGSMLITLPYGASDGDYWIRYYNSYSLKRLLHGLDFDPEHFLKDGENWRACSEEEASKMPSGEGALPQAIVCVTAVKKG